VGVVDATRRTTAEQERSGWQRLTPASRSRKRTLVPIGRYKGLGRAAISAYHEWVQTLPISKVKDKLNELVDAAAVTHEQVTITKNGSPAAVLIGVDEWESIQETLFWLSQPNIHEDIAAARQDIATGQTYSEDQIRAEFGVPKRSR
jgi:antitoxin YefM